jgi:hypothetical protein
VANSPKPSQWPYHHQNANDDKQDAQPRLIYKLGELDGLFCQGDNEWIVDHSIDPTRPGVDVVRQTGKANYK